jgi:hypothetical protein
MWLRRRRESEIAQLAGEPHLQLRFGAAAASTTAASAPAASAAATGDADLPGRLGDPGDGHVPAATATAAAAAGTRTRLRQRFKTGTAREQSRADFFAAGGT